MKDIQAQVLAIDAGLLSRRKAVEATGYDIEEIDREAARVADMTAFFSVEVDGCAYGDVLASYSHNTREFDVVYQPTWDRGIRRR